MADVGAVLEQMRGTAVAQGVRRDAHGETGGPGAGAHEVPDALDAQARAAVGGVVTGRCRPARDALGRCQTTSFAQLEDP